MRASSIIFAFIGIGLMLYASRSRASTMPRIDYTPTTPDNTPTNYVDFIGAWDIFDAPQQETTMAESLTRGERNNNPGNIERNTIQWQGMADDQSGDSRFVVFISPEYGVRAIGKILQTYQRNYGLNTIKGIISRWAPSTENNTAAYVNAVARDVGIDPNAPINVFDQNTLHALVNAIIRHENGRNIYATSGVVDAGLALA